MFHLQESLVCWLEYQQLALVYRSVGYLVCHLDDQAKGSESWIRILVHSLVYWHRILVFRPWVLVACLVHLHKSLVCWFEYQQLTLIYRLVDCLVCHLNDQSPGLVYRYQILVFHPGVLVAYLVHYLAHHVVNRLASWILCLYNNALRLLQ